MLVYSRFNFLPTFPTHLLCFLLSILCNVDLNSTSRSKMPKLFWQAGDSKSSTLFKIFLNLGNKLHATRISGIKMVIDSCCVNLQQLKLQERRKIEQIKPEEQIIRIGIFHNRMVEMGIKYLPCAPKLANTGSFGRGSKSVSTVLVCEKGLFPF